MSPRLPWLLLLVLGVCAGCQEYGLQENMFTDVFDQGTDEDRVVDVLWVLDNSGTMAEEQGRLAESLGEVLLMFEETLAAFRLGVITTDVDDSEQRGRLQGHPSVISPQTEDITGSFLSNASVGILGSKEEQGLEALRLALTEARDDPANEGFFRADTGLHVVVVSDEDDHSPGEVSDLLAGLMVLVPDSTEVHAVVGDEPDGCLSSEVAADSGSRYLDAARRTGGYSGSICLEDWTPLLGSIVRSSLGLDDTFPLSHEPDPDTLEVRVDSVLIPQRETDGWIHDLGTNAIVLHGNAVPRPGMQVVVTYYLKR